MAIVRVSWIILAVVGAVAVADAVPQDPMSRPDADFLEFLGSWQTEGDRWVDPFQVDEAYGAEQDQHDSDRRGRDAHSENAPQAVSPRDGPRQSERESTVPRRDVKP